MEFVSLNAIVNDLLLIIRGANISNSEPISRRQIENWVHQYRALYLTQEIDKGRYLNPDYIQELPFVELEQVPVEGTSLSTSYSGYTSTGNILRTKLQLPKTLDTNYKNGFAYIGTPDGREIQYIPEGRSMWQQYRTYTGTQPMVFLKNRYLHLIGNTEGIEHLTVRGVFEVPSEAGRFSNPVTNVPAFDMNSKYPIPIELLTNIKHDILEKELNITATAPSDTKNDSDHGVSQQIEN